MKKIIGSIVFLVICSILLSLPVMGTDGIKKPVRGPVNPAFLKFQSDMEAGKYSMLTSSGKSLGRIPSPVDFSRVNGIVDPSVVKGYPSTYDLRDTNKVTSVKNQGQCGACWAFAALGSLESYLMPTENLNFSEQHLNSTHGFDWVECKGGTDLMAIAYLTRWDGPIDENDVSYPYDSSNSSNVNSYTILKHIQQVIFLPERANYLDNDTIKNFIMTYGGVVGSYYDDEANFNPDYNSYYYNTNSSQNHAIVIVGWDDDFAASKFVTPPPGNGAFLVKGSWSRFYGNKGYYYISYYDTSLNDFVSYNNAETTSNYQGIYQYDPLGLVSEYGYDSTIAWGANIFTANSYNSIKAVGFYLADSNSKYDIYIYKGVSNSQPRSGTLVATRSGSKTYSGYYTETLSSPVNIEVGEKFSVVIKFTTSTYQYPVPVEYPHNNYSSGAKANSGESFLSYDGTDWTDMTTENADTNVCIKAYADIGPSSGSLQIGVNRSILNFAHVVNGSTTGSQQFTLSKTGTGTLNWTISKAAGADWLSFTPSSGSNSGTVTVSVNPTGLSAGTYTGTISVTATGATNSPQNITVKLSVIAAGQSQVPFGEFATPVNNSSVSSSIAVTGWVLDDVEVTGVKIFNGSTFVGDALFIEGARPDVQQAYPNYPFNFKAGWGYMLLTNFLPNGGNGTYTLIAKAYDKEGNEYTLGSKTITCDNANAVKPFGAIDTPEQGGTAYGKEYINWGWVLSPKPNSIPINGSTINVYIDGVYIGHPGYNIYRSDIATLFPGYANSDGASGYFYLDTSKYEDGVHTIQWTATNNAGHADGIGSRYFNIQNSTASGSSGSISSSHPVILGRVDSLPSMLDKEKPSIRTRTGYDEDIRFQPAVFDERGTALISIREDERIALDLKEEKSNPMDSTSINIEGYQVVGDSLVSLPIGSTLDKESGKFYWQPGPGFVGKYRMVFIIRDDDGHVARHDVIVNITPRF